MARENKIHWGRWITSLVVVAGAIVATVLLVNHASTKKKTVAPANPLVTATVSAGSLVRSDQVTGQLVLSDTFIVRHRIAGQTASSNSAAGAATTTAAASTSGRSGSSSAGGSSAGGGGGPQGAFPVTTTTIPCAPGSTTTTSSTTTSSTTTSSTTTTVAPTTPVAPVTLDPPGPSSTAPGGSTTTTVCGTGGGSTTTAPRGGGGRSGAGGFTRTSTASGAAGSLASRVTQTVTSITTVGTTIGNGDVLYTIDGQAVIALVGPLPAWRSLSTASPAGPDVEELQKALIALGYDPAGDVTPSETFDAATQAMVERWQAGQSLPVTGQVALGSVVFIPKAMTVLAVSHTVGDAVGDGDVVVTLAGSSQQVQIIAPTNDQPYLVPGFKVDLGSAGTGTVTSLNSVTQSGTAAVQVVIAPSSPIGGVANGGSVTVTLNIDVADHVLIVPAQALASRLDGSYAVEVKSADGSVHWTPVHFVAVAGLNVGITASGLGAGTVVLMPQE